LVKYISRQQLLEKTMKQNQAGPATDRRRFLKGVAAAGGATALTAFSVSRLVAADSDGPDTQKHTENASRGYHETEHIREYYRTLRT